jgi:DNA-binding NtrC family response regulator
VTPIRTLVIDDLLGRDPVEARVFSSKIGVAAHAVVGQSDQRRDIVVAFEAGQRITAAAVRNDYELIRAAVAGERESASAASAWSLILLDVRFDSGALREDGTTDGGLEDDTFGEVVRERLIADFGDLPIVLLTSKRQVELKQPTVPYLAKDGLDEREFAVCLLRHGRLTSEQRRCLLGLGPEIVAESEASLIAFQTAFVHARENVSVSIRGESGTGKEVLARYIHARSQRTGRFVAINVSAIPQDQIEAELFGIEDRAATGVSRRIGLFELAIGGTLFLDEIGDMPLAAQAKVLRALQEREVLRVGGREPVALDFRLVTATARDLEAMVQSNTFRADLLHRLNTVRIDVPPLRARRAELARMARALLERFSRAFGKRDVTLAADAETLLADQPFPGNVRELENVIQRLVSAAGHGQLIDAGQVRAALSPATPATDRALAAPVARVEAPLATVPHSTQAIALAALPSLLSGVDVTPSDPSVGGLLPRLQGALNGLSRRLAAAALEAYRDKRDGSLNLQGAMQYLTADKMLSGKGPGRLMNSLMGRKQDLPVTAAELEEFVKSMHAQEDAGHGNAGHE